MLHQGLYDGRLSPQSTLLANNEAVKRSGGTLIDLDTGATSNDDFHLVKGSSYVPPSLQILYFWLDSLTLDEEKLLDIMKEMIHAAASENIGLVIDFDTCELFPNRWFDLVLVLRAGTEALFDRLVVRGYSKKKWRENVDHEIMRQKNREFWRDLQAGLKT